MSQEPDSSLVRVSSSQLEAERSAPSSPIIRILTAEGEELRAKLKVHLEREIFDKESIIRIVKPYGAEVVQSVLPTFIGGLIERRTRQQVTAEKIRTAVLELEQEHQFNFRWNGIYQNFLKGLFVETKDQQRGIKYVCSVLGDDYKTFLNLPAGRDSNVRLLSPICKLMGLLDMTKEELRTYIFKVRDQRCESLVGTQGHRRTVTIADLESVKDALTRLKWMPPAAKRSRDMEAKETANKRRRLGTGQ